MAEVCRLSRQEYEALTDYDEKPKCKNHRHCSTRAADELLDSGYWFKVESLGKPKIAPEDGRTWKRIDRHGGRIYGGPAIPGMQYR